MTYDQEDLPLPVASSGSAAARRSLMRDWEREAVVDEAESEAELMVLLSGMVGASVTTVGDA